MILHNAPHTCSYACINEFSLLLKHIEMASDTIYEGGLIIKGRFLVTLKITALETSHFACILSNQLSNHTSQNRSV